jgi:hypothetical protein
MKKRVVFPWGGCGNHLRWLMYFDKSFDAFHFSKDRSLESKLKFIETSIYTKERTWHNWIAFEWKHRLRYNAILKIEGGHHALIYEKNTKSIILSYTDYTECAIRYVIFTSFKEITTPLADIDEHYAKYSNHLKSIIVSPFDKVIVSDVIWEDVLDKNFYYDIIDFWGFEDHYEYAARVHTLWKECHNRAVHQFMETCTNDEYLNFIKKGPIK